LTEPCENNSQNGVHEVFMYSTYSIHSGLLLCNNRMNVTFFMTGTMDIKQMSSYSVENQYK
jgi:hypothetical protein